MNAENTCLMIKRKRQKMQERDNSKLQCNSGLKVTFFRLLLFLLNIFPLLIKVFYRKFKLVLFFINLSANMNNILSF